jgi:hypothetical protein
VQFEYDSNYRKVKMEKTTKGRLDYYILYKYDELGNIKNEEVYVNGQTLYMDSYSEYNYNNNHRLISKATYANLDKNDLKKINEFSYDTITIHENGLTKKIINHEINLYDKMNRLIEKRDSNNVKLIKYEYRGSLLISESHYTDKDQIIERYLYSYDKEVLIKRYKEMYADVSLNGKYKKLGNYELEEYKYYNGKMIEKRTIDHGIDPCGSYCCGNYIIKYEYKR